MTLSDRRYGCFNSNDSFYPFDKQSHEENPMRNQLASEEGTVENPVIEEANAKKSKKPIIKEPIEEEPPVEPVKLDPLVVPKYVNQLEKPLTFVPHVVRTRVKKKGKYRLQKQHHYRIDIGETKEQMLPQGFPKTKVFGYGGMVKDPKTGKVRYHISSPGSTFEAQRDIPVVVKWRNRIKGPHFLAVDPTLHWANPNDMPMHPHKPWPSFPPGFPEAQKPVPTVTHLHGAEVQSDSDGHPEAWFTYNGKVGPTFVSTTYTYPNTQEPTTMWYHDHTMGMTRLNVYAGLAGFYLLRDGKVGKKQFSEQRLKLPSGKYEIPLIIQDKMFNTDGSLLFANEGLNPEVNPYWSVGFFGDIIVVNGKAWPNLNVERRQYRFRILNGSNSRFYNLSMSNGMEFIQIGTDGGLLRSPVKLRSLLLAPAERADILVDFSAIEPGSKIQLINDAVAPFPFGGPPDPETVGQIMQFTVEKHGCKPVKPEKLPKYLNYIPKLQRDVGERIVTMNDIAAPSGIPLQMLLGGQLWSSPVSETPRVGSTEDWLIVGMTAGAHPVHLHLIQFQLINRQNLDVTAYTRDWNLANGTMPLNHPTITIPVEPYLIGDPIPPNENELGWKDTIIVNPGQVTRIRVRIAPQDVPEGLSEPGENFFTFDPTSGPGYVWHCHLLDHEDNEMMRPMNIIK